MTMTMQLKKPQSGFTLVEIAIVLVIVGLLLGGILKGQELINSARVRNLADTSAGTQAAYYGFIDRFRRVPGDMQQGEADNAIAATINSGGDGNGRLDDAGAAANVWQEAAALWEHLAKAGFIKGTYDGFDDAGAIPADEATYIEAGAPINAFNESMVMGRTADYRGTNPAVRLNLVFGRGIPVDIARELDVKLDDGRPWTGVLRLTLDDTAGGADFGTVGQYDDTTECQDATGAPPDENVIYDIALDGQDCNVTFMY